LKAFSGDLLKVLTISLAWTLRTWHQTKLLTFLSLASEEQRFPLQWAPRWIPQPQGSRCRKSSIHLEVPEKRLSVWFLFTSQWSYSKHATWLHFVLPVRLKLSHPRLPWFAEQGIRAASNWVRHLIDRATQRLRSCVSICFGWFQDLTCHLSLWICKVMLFLQDELASCRLNCHQETGDHRSEGQPCYLMRFLFYQLPVLASPSWRPSAASSLCPAFPRSHLHFSM